MIEKFIISLTKKSERKLDKLILENCPPSLSLSRTKIQDLIKRQMVFDPQKNYALTSKTRTNDIEQVVLYVDKELQKNLIPEDLEVPVVFEDKSLVVFNKPANMVVHPVKSSQRGTLVNFLIYNVYGMQKSFVQSFPYQYLLLIKINFYFDKEGMENLYLFLT